MTTFLDIFINVLIPMFALILLGVFFHRIFHFDLNTLSKVTMYYLLPANVFVKVYESNMNWELFFEVTSFQLFMFLALYVFSTILSRILKLNKGISVNFKNSVILMNSGNYGLPISQFVFQNNPLGITIQVIIMTFQNIITYTYGLINSVIVKNSGKNVTWEFLKIPVLYALIISIIFQKNEIYIPQFIWIPLENISNSFLAIALFVLGAQISNTKILRLNKIVLLSCFSRLIFSPIIALVLIIFLGIEGITAKALLIASSYPSSRNSAQIALEYKNYPELAAEMVITSTILSVITVSFVIFLAEILF